MKRFHVLSCALGLALALTGCGDDDTGPADTGPRPDTGMVDSGGRDSTTECTPADREDTFELCNDGCDNDGNGFQDCGDTGDFSCSGTSCAAVCDETGPENTMEACTDECDNDGNGFIDCDDRACAPLEICSSVVTTENSNVACADGIDNDGNGFTDCADFGCFRAAADGMPATGRAVCLQEITNAACSDGMDNDGDGMMDCADSDCQGDAIVVCDGAEPTGVAEAQWAAMITARCANGMDDDGAGFTDCGDRTCQYFAAACLTAGFEGGNAACSDGMDNDLDGATDCEDPGCNPTFNESIVVCDDEGNPVDFANDAAITAAANTRCSDGSSNGENTFVDCADNSCKRDALVTVCDATTEGNVRTCAPIDGEEVDEDGNGFADCGDFACSQHPDFSFCPDLERSPTACSDGRDNDGNGFADCRDRGCERLDVCRPRPEAD
jgi:hypothetical protein